MDEARRREQFQKILQLIQSRDSQLVVMGDFNAIQAHHEKEGRRCKSEFSIEDFIDFINQGEFANLGFEGDKCTWCNHQFGGNLIC
ncbi:hypothetical protein AHAS_AhasUnG0032800 [Arachis hypogaea]